MNPIKNKPYIKCSFFYKKREEDLGEVYANITCNRTKTSMPTGVWISKDEFSDGYIHPKSPDGRVARQNLDNFNEKVKAINVQSHMNAAIVKDIMKDCYVEGTHEHMIVNGMLTITEKIMLSNYTRESYEQTIHDFASWVRKVLGYRDLLLNKLTPSIVFQYVDHIVNSGNSYSTIKQKMSTLATLYNHYIIENSVESFPINPFYVAKKRARILARKAKWRRIVPYEYCLSDEDIDVIKNYKFSGAKKHTYHRFRLTILFQIHTGFSFRELGMTDGFEIIDTKNGRALTVRRGKTGIECFIPYTEELEAIHNELKENSYKRGLFPIKSFEDGKGDIDVHKRRIEYNKYDRFLTMFSRAVGFPLNPHLFRHTFGMLMSRRGVPLETVSKMMGHSSIRTTEKYYVKPSAEMVMGNYVKVTRKHGKIDKKK